MGKSVLSEERKGMLAAALTYTIFGLSYLFSKMALNVTDPTILLWLRFTVTFLCLNVLIITGAAKVRFRGKPSGTRTPGTYYPDRDPIN